MKKGRLAYNILFVILVLCFFVLLSLRFDSTSYFQSLISQKVQNFYQLFVSSSLLNRNEPLKSKYTLIDSNRVSVGVGLDYVNPETFKEVFDYESTVGHKMSLMQMYIAWGDEKNKFPIEYEKGWKDLNITPIITWEPWKKDFSNPTAIQTNYSLQSISEGLQDQYIREWAIEAKKYGLPVIIRFAHEQSTPPNRIIWYPWQGNPEMYKSSFKHIVEIFRSEGADNVKFMWNPYAGWDKYTMIYYPGDKYVDYIGYTVINHGTDSPTDKRWKVCNEQFLNQYNRLKELKQPIIIAEFASTENGGSKSEWIKDCVQMFLDNEKIVGMVALEFKEDQSMPNISWSMNSSLSSLNTYKYYLSVGNFR